MSDNMSKGALRRAIFGYRLARALMTPLFARLYAYQKPALKPLPEPYLLIPNHSTDMDFLMMMHSFDRPMDFVVGESLLRSPVLRFLFTRFHRPIIINKGGAEAKATFEILRRLRMGRNVCLFAEGNTCFDGVTGPIPRGTGQLARASGASLVTFRVQGGFLSAPRWGQGLRRGKSWGELGQIYSPQQLREMSLDAVNAAIARDLHVDAMAQQRARPIDYVSRRRALGLPNPVYLCPQCHSIDSFAARGAHIRCGSCELDIHYDARGFLSGWPGLSTLADWLAWQRHSLQSMMASPGGLQLSDQGQTLRLVHENHRAQDLATGTLLMDAEGLRLGDRHFTQAQLVGFAIYRKDRLVFTSDQGRRYEITTRGPRSALKYRDYYQLLRERE